MNTKTPMFRIALSIAAIWFAVWVVMAWRDFSTATAPSRLTDNCYRDVPTYENGVVGWRTATQDDIAACEQSNRTIEAKFDQERFQDALKALGGFALLWLVLPICVLLMVTVFAASIRSGVSSGVRRYFRWIKSGK